jgi:hypothetical protein
MDGELVWSLDAELSALVPSFVKGGTGMGRNMAYTLETEAVLKIFGILC